MKFYRQLALLLVFAAPALWAQSKSTPEVDKSNPPVAQSPNTAIQTDSSVPPDSTKLEPLKTPHAVYPLAATQKGIQGQVMLKIVISETGDVESAEAISGDPLLTDAAVDAVKKWKFKPFIKNGRPVKVSTKVPMNFAFSGQVEDTPVPKTEAKGDTVGSNGTEPPKRVRISQGVSEGMLIHKVIPVYPAEARANRVQGNVILQAVIDRDGRLKDIRAVQGAPELISAAVGAVQQWRYKPYYLKGEPVEVETVITVNFTLTR